MLLTMREVSAYRAVSSAALQVVARIPPIGLLAQERMRQGTQVVVIATSTTALVLDET